MYRNHVVHPKKITQLKYIQSLFVLPCQSYLSKAGRKKQLGEMAPPLGRLRHPFASLPVQPGLASSAHSTDVSWVFTYFLSLVAAGRVIVLRDVQVQLSGPLNMSPHRAKRALHIWLIILRCGGCHSLFWGAQCNYKDPCDTMSYKKDLSGHSYDQTRISQVHLVFS